jgi:YggT family protein
MNIILNVIQSLFDVLSLFIIAHVFLSWFRVDRSNRFVKMVDNVVEPMLKPVRKMMPRTGMIDLSPVVLLIGLEVSRVIFLRLLVS